jgi:hypothetical protein
MVIAGVWWCALLSSGCYLAKIHTTGICSRPAELCARSEVCNLARQQLIGYIDILVSWECLPCSSEAATRGCEFTVHDGGKVERAEPAAGSEGAASSCFLSGINLG